MDKVARNHNIFNTCLCGLILLWLCSVHVRTIKTEENQFHYSIPESVKIGNGDSLCFFSRGIDFKVYVTADEDRRQIFEYAQNGAGLTGKDIGLVMQTVPINKTDRQDKITFLITPSETTAFMIQKDKLIRKCMNVKKRMKVTRE